MTIEAIDYVYVETHNWGKSAKFWTDLGLVLELDLGNAGKLVPPTGGPGIFLEEVPPDRELAFQVYFKVSSADDTFTDSHWGTKLKEVSDPDGRVYVLQHGTPDEE